MEQSPPESEIKRFAWRINDLRQQLNHADLPRLSYNTASGYDSHQRSFNLAYWGQSIEIHASDWIARQSASRTELSLMDQAMLLYYFITADGFLPADQWISFAELPDGRFYNKAFQGYTGQLLSRTFSEDLAGFQTAARICAGTPSDLGDASFIFQILPRVNLLVVFWLGDEDFTSSSQILFDASASHYLPTDAYAILGSTLTHKLMKSKASKS